MCYVRTAVIAPETKYAKSGDVHIAYRVVGEGPFDLVFTPGWVSHVEYAWEEPSLGPFLRRLASFSRLLILDRRGTGLSDRVARLPTLEERMDDIRAVMDAAGSKRATIFGVSESGPMSVLFAATYPERTRALVLCNTLAKGLRADDYPWGRSGEAAAAFLDHFEANWGTGVTLDLFAQSIAQDPQHRASWARFERLAVSPGGLRVLVGTLAEMDVRAVLPLVQAPTLVLTRAGDKVMLPAEGRFLAEHIPGGRFVELPGDDHFPWTGDTEAVLGEVQEFLTGAREAVESDRVLATVLFTDIVDSTARAAELGDRRWRETLDAHDGAIAREITRFRGRLIKHTGDGALATFDGPARAIESATAIREQMHALGLEIRAGLHTGEVELRGQDVGGIAVHIGARVAASAVPGEIRVSSTVRDLVVGSSLRFAERGAHTLKGVPGEWQLFAVA